MTLVPVDIPLIAGSPSPIRRTIMRHEHWFWLACENSLTDEFHSILYWLLRNVYDTLLGYRGPAVDPPQSLAHIAANQSESSCNNAQAYIEATIAKIFTLTVQASYLFADGNPNLVHRTSIPHGTTRIVSDKEPAAEPVQTRPLYELERLVRIPIDQMTEAQRDAMLWDGWFQAVIATLNRCKEEQYGAYGTAIFFVLCTTVFEVQRLVETSMAEYGWTDDQRNTVIQYLSSEMEALTTDPTDWESAHEMWSETLAVITDNVLTQNFERMAPATQTRENAKIAKLEEVRKSTEKKRQTRKANKARRNAKSDEDDGDSPMDTSPERPAVTPDEDDDDDDDDDDEEFLKAVTSQPVNSPQN